MPVSAADLRRIEAVESPPPGHWVGDGFPVTTMFSYGEDSAVSSPFLLLDYAAPSEFQPTAERRGVGSHPHRGFETVTIVYQGELEHRDSAGHRGGIGPGDVQWMTAGSGVLHEEFHGESFANRGGVFEVAQIWVNLPAKHKMSPPGYQDIRDAQIPAVPLPGGGGKVRVIAGECLGAKGAARTFTPVEMWDLQMSSGGRAYLTMPEGYTAMLLVSRGPVRVNHATAVPAAHLVRFERKGAGFVVEAGNDARVLVLGGAPIREPVVGQGPFVMNTRAEIAQAIDDFRRGKFGTLA